MLVVLMLTHFLFSKTGVSIRKNLVTESRYETVIDISTAFHNAKVTGTDRSLAQLTADRIVMQNPNVPYGVYFGSINVDDQLTDFFDTYFDDRWALVFNDDKYESFSLGHKIPKLEDKVVYNILVPLPNIGKEIVELNLYTW
jgi:hypothetical protein